MDLIENKIILRKFKENPPSARGIEPASFFAISKKDTGKSPVSAIQLTRPNKKHHP
ncbi:MAG: hypothetical protein K0B15_06500 [Lentimicrobium sp.]|nr:hypothetical protein [Lentimicrobium sp.]